MPTIFSHAAVPLALAVGLGSRTVPPGLLLAGAVFVGACVASLGVLDIFAKSGLGVELWWPFSQERVFSAWRVIEVSPLSLQRIFGARGLEVLRSELLWIGLPAFSLGLLLFALRRQGPYPALERTAVGKPAAGTRIEPSQ